MFFIFSRRCLEECPQLGTMDDLQLLNLQHNLITRIQDLSHLQQLVFLNLYDNHISEMTGIESLSSLRILMLGKNRWVVVSGFTSKHKNLNRFVWVASVTLIELCSSYLWYYSKSCRAGLISISSLFCWFFLGGIVCLSLFQSLFVSKLIGGYQRW